MNSMLWLILLAILLIVEMATLGLTTIWFAGGALVAFIVSLFYDNILLEISLFLVISLLLLIFTRPFVKKYFNSTRIKTNYEALIGKEAIVTATIDNDFNTGLAVVNGQEWSARSVDGSKIEKGSKVIIENISGVKLMVSIKKEG
ncbi:membrane protein implicated in regulation of membrane protease activity [Herbinix hemicellulosilytica]|uniref:Putative membrane protein n=1 Tax=Herbinix hemicellulosilytica TaxID=1564487 RepID=A0A0H5SCW8_HERHM|nr:NfeD family protein [Herbinix hemicellulosilytica]RBP57021.1 membrane protein implicated in regulation of membrane protease activity [Herbinix hemicellulosilytica]CRZ33254.1 putative membrane protein [Herbinix hemicellulosilytica]